MVAACPFSCWGTVALRKESVDRNIGASYGRTAKMVALRKESVDRNLVVGLLCTFTSLSLSARRAWIEIFRPSPQVKPVRVALRKESVDRKFVDDYQFQRVWVALRKESVDRKADEQLFRIYQISVALRKESVDRNVFLTLTVRNVPSRSPQGERG